MPLRTNSPTEYSSRQPQSITEGFTGLYRWETPPSTGRALDLHTRMCPPHLKTQGKRNIKAKSTQNTILNLQLSFKK